MSRYATFPHIESSTSKLCSKNQSLAQSFIVWGEAKLKLMVTMLLGFISHKPFVNFQCLYARITSVMFVVEVFHINC
jgi:hypothetical protein